MADFLPYEEPSVTAILILTSFFFFVNVIDWSLNRLGCCGLLGQILLGTAWGTPGAAWLSSDVEATITQLGYLGLLLLIFEGGLHSSISQLRADFFLSTAVALTGVALPLGLSFLLVHLADATPLQFFAAGATLSSTSLGTTLTVLRASGFVQTRLGTVLTSAALLDDVAGLIMVQLIQDLGSSSTGDSVAAAILRPLGVSVGLVAVLCLVCRVAVRPLSQVLVERMEAKDGSRLSFVRSSGSALVLQTAVLVGMVTAASYAGGSNLFAAYLAGATVSWWYDTCQTQAFREASTSSQTGPQSRRNSDSPAALATPGSGQHRRPAQTPTAAQTASPEAESEPPSSSSSSSSSSSFPLTSSAVYDEYFASAVTRVLKPCFFASIGFALPIRTMFTGSIVWRGLVYAVLMALGKLATGVWLVRARIEFGVVRKILNILRGLKRSKIIKDGVEMRHRPRKAPNGTAATPEQGMPTSNTPSVTGSAPRADTQIQASTLTASQSSLPSAPPSLYPALLLGTAMIPRGEIGFLIAALAQAQGLFGQVGSSQLFLIVNWAVFACTAAGPVATALLARRIRKLEQRREPHGAGRRPLGVWGVE